MAQAGTAAVVDSQDEAERLRKLRKEPADAPIQVHEGRRQQRLSEAGGLSFWRMVLVHVVDKHLLDHAEPATLCKLLEHLRCEPGRVLDVGLGPPVDEEFQDSNETARIGRGNEECAARLEMQAHAFQTEAAILEVLNVVRGDDDAKRYTQVHPLDIGRHGFQAPVPKRNYLFLMTINADDGSCGLRESRLEIRVLPEIAGVGVDSTDV